MSSELPAEVANVTPIRHGEPRRDDAVAGGDSAHRNLVLLYGGARPKGAADASAGAPDDSRVGMHAVAAAGWALAGS